MLPELDIDGQEKLLRSKVLIIGLGGLGAPLALYLAAAGIGHLTLVDDDHVEPSNLQRQIIHGTSNIGESKVISAMSSINAINPDCQVNAIQERLDREQLERQVAQADLVLDATDNFATRYAINAACAKAGVPLVSGAAIRWEGQVAVFDFRDPESPCYACLYPDTNATSDLSCADNGVAAPIVGIIGSIQALEAVKLIAAAGDSLSGYVLVMDGKYQQWQKLQLARAEHCIGCAGR